MNFEDLDMQKLNISTDSAQRVDVKMGSFVKLSCLLPELLSLKYQRRLILHFLLMTQKNSHRLGKIFKCILKRSFWVLSENGMVTVYETLMVGTQKRLLSQHKILKSCIFKGWHVANGRSYCFIIPVLFVTVLFYYYIFHYVLVWKIHIYMLKMLLSNLLLFSTEYLLIFGVQHVLLPIWPRSHEL